jgi:hypothetical protein
MHKSHLGSRSKRRGWDSNPRAAKSDNLISSQARYNHFGTSPEEAFLTQRSRRKAENARDYIIIDSGYQVTIRKSYTLDTMQNP